MSAVSIIRKAYAILYTQLPGPDRLRLPIDYRFRLAYRNPDPDAVGCVMLWEVRGGRTPYQIAIERDERGEMHSHCTCADAVFRGPLGGHVCKHVKGFFQLAQPGGCVESATNELSACA